jgi:hypothetical protein
MIEPHEDVEQPESSAGNVEQEAETGAVKPDGAERPIKNVQAEFNRKFTKVERQQMETNQRLDAIAQLLIAQNQPQSQQQQQQAPPGPLTDEQLWEQAKNGNRLAFDEYKGRIAERKIQQYSAVSQQQNTVAAQMQALINKYPVFNDGNHELTQTAQTAYQLMVRNGEPANAKTLLEAAKTAIADRPDLVSNLYAQGSQARESARRNASQSAQSGQMGASNRYEAPKRSDAVTVKAGEVALARRMLQQSKHHPEEKTPEQRAKGAKERFLARQQSGESKLGAVSGFVNGDDF